MTDERLMAAYAAGDLDAFHTLYERHRARVMGYLLAHASSPEEAHDLFQEVFAKLHAGRARYREEIPFLAWIFTISRSTFIDHLRKKRTRSRFVPTATQALEAAPDTSDAAPSVGSWTEALARLPGLSPQQREALVLRFEEGLTFGDIAARLELSPSNARQIVSRTLRRLRSLLRDEERLDEEA